MLRVECYAGYRGEQEAVAYWLGERRFPVPPVDDRWFGPGPRWFRIAADDAQLCVLRRGERREGPPRVHRERPGGAHRAR